MDTPKKYVIIFAKDEQGNEIKQRFMVSITKTLKQVEESLMKNVMSIDGIDRMEIHGRYTFEIIIARSFDATVAIAELEKRLEDLLSDIVRPKLVV